MITLQISLVCATGSSQYKCRYFGEAGRECSPAGCTLFSFSFLFLFSPAKEIKPSAWKICPIPCLRGHYLSVPPIANHNHTIHDNGALDLAFNLLQLFINKNLTANVGHCLFIKHPTWRPYLFAAELLCSCPAKLHFSPWDSGDKVLPWACPKIWKQHNGEEVSIGAAECRDRH